jgi:hypothetical protein
MTLHQEINLYQGGATTTRALLPARDVFIATSCIGAALLAFWSYGYLQVSKLSHELATVREQQTRQQQQMQATMQSATAPEDLAAVQSRVEKLRAQVAARSAALKALSGEGAQQNTNGFAARLEALARRHVEGVWLDGMQLAAPRTEMSLSGATAEPQLISQYLQNLSLDPALTGARFDEFVIERKRDGEAPTAPSVVHFHASSPGLAPKTEDKS